MTEMEGEEDVREAPRLALVVPCYNEEEALPESTTGLRASSWPTTGDIRTPSCAA